MTEQKLICSIYLLLSTIEPVKTTANQENRSFSNQVEVLLLEALDARNQKTKQNNNTHRGYNG
jgi:hypothetical protein